MRGDVARADAGISSEWVHGGERISPVGVFPRLLRLTESRGVPVELMWRGAKLEASSIEYKAPSKRFYGSEQARLKLIISDPSNRCTLAYADVGISEKRRNVAVCSERSRRAPDPLGDSKDVGSQLFGFAVRENERGQGVGSLLLALACGTLESRGVVCINFEDDVTALGEGGLQKQDSFYAATADVVSSEIQHRSGEGGGEDICVTTVRTALTDKQIEILTEALNGTGNPPKD